MLIAILAVAMTQVNVSVCDIQKKPSSYRDHLVSIHAEIVSAWPHGAFLRDQSCPNRILLLGYDLSDADESAKNLMPSLFSACVPSAPHKTFGQFTGRVSYSAKGVVEFRLQSVRQLDYTPCPPPVVPLHF